MLHLMLAGNLLNALGGAVDLYNAKFIPEFPQKFFKEKKAMNLQRLDRGTLKTFIRVRAINTDAGSLQTFLPTARDPTSPIAGGSRDTL
jgi:hypothetical protein